MNAKMAVEQLRELAPELLPTPSLTFGLCREVVLGRLRDQGPDLAGAWKNYQEAADEAIEALRDSDHPAAHIGLMLDKARLYSQAHRLDECLAELEDAHTYAVGMQYWRVAGRIERIATSLQRSDL